MARRNGPTDPELDSASGTPPEFDDFEPALDEVDSRARDAAEPADSPFLRKPKRVPARKGAVTRKTAGRIKLTLFILGCIAIAGTIAVVAHTYGQKAQRFRIGSSDQIEIAGNKNVSRQQVIEVFGGDISRNTFAVPLEERKAALEAIPWVESATVMRLLPNRLKVQIVERTPVAIARVGSRPLLIDSHGVLMEPPAGEEFSFPVIVDFDGQEPLSTRAARMKIFAALVRDLDSDGGNYSTAIDDIYLADPNDVKVQVRDGNILLHLGDSNFLGRYKTYLANIAKWRQDVGEVTEIDLRYERQVVVHRAETEPPPAAAAPAAPRPATAVKAAARAAAKRKASARRR